MDSSGNSLVGLVDSDSNVAVAEQVIFPKGTVTFRVGEVSTTTTIVISFTVSVPLAGRNACLVGPGDSEIWSNLTTVVLVDGVWIFIFSVVLWGVGTFHLAFNTDAPPLSSTGHVALVWPASLNVVALLSEEPLEDLLILHIGSTNGVHSDFAFCSVEGVVASTAWSKMIRIIARSVGLAILFGQSGGATCWHLTVSFLDMVCWYVWEIRRIRRKPKPGHVEGLLTWEDTGGQILCQGAIGG